MVFTDNKSAGDLIKSQDWDDFVDFAELISSNAYGFSSNAKSLYQPSGVIVSGVKYTQTYEWMINSGAKYTNIYESGSKYTNTYTWFVASAQKLSAYQASGDEWSAAYDWYAESAQKISIFVASGDKYSNVYTWYTVSSSKLTDAYTERGSQIAGNNLTWNGTQIDAAAGGISTWIAPTAVSGIQLTGPGRISGSLSIGIDDYIASTNVVTNFAGSSGIHTYVDTISGNLDTKINTKEDTLTKGNLTATSPIALDQTRQVIGGAAVVSISNYIGSTQAIDRFADSSNINAKIDAIDTPTTWSDMTTSTGLTPITVGVSGSSGTNVEVLGYSTISSNAYDGMQFSSNSDIFDHEIYIISTNAISRFAGSSGIHTYVDTISSNLDAKIDAIDTPTTWGTLTEGTGIAPLTGVGISGSGDNDVTVLGYATISSQAKQGYDFSSSSDLFDQTLYITSSNAIDRFYLSSLGKSLMDFSSNASNLYAPKGGSGASWSGASEFYGFSSNTKQDILDLFNASTSLDNRIDTLEGQDVFDSTLYVASTTAIERFADSSNYSTHKDDSTIHFTKTSIDDDYAGSSQIHTYINTISGALDTKIDTKQDALTGSEYYPSSLGKGVSGNVKTLNDWYEASAQKLSAYQASGDEWSEAYSWYTASASRISEFVASGDEYSSAYLSAQRVIDSFDQTLYVTSANIIANYVKSANALANFVGSSSFDTWRSNVDQTEMSYLDGVTSDIQTQIDGKDTLDEISWTTPTAGDAISLDSTTGMVSGALTIKVDADSITQTMLKSGSVYRSAVLSGQKVEETFTAADESKLDGIEASADVTDTENVNQSLGGQLISSNAKTAYDWFVASSQALSAYQASGDEWSAAYDWYSASASRISEFVASGDEYSQAYASAQRVKDLFNHELYATSSNIYNQTWIDSLSGSIDSRLDTLEGQDVFDETLYITSANALDIFADSSNYSTHKDDEDIHFPSSNLTGWLDNVYEAKGASGLSWSGATDYISFSSNSRNLYYPSSLGSVASSNIDSLFSFSSNSRNLYQESGATSQHLDVISISTQSISGVTSADVRVNAIGDTDLDNLQHVDNHTNSAVLFSGGTITIGGITGSINISEGEVAIRNADSDYADIYYATVPAVSDMILPADNSIIYVDYNAGSPVYANKQTWAFNLNTQFPMGQVYNDWGSGSPPETGISQGGFRFNSLGTRTAMRFRAEGTIRTDGLVVASSQTTGHPLAIGMTAGSLWRSLNKFTTTTQDAGHNHDITAVNTTDNWFSVTGSNDPVARGNHIRVEDSTGNDGVYIVSSLAHPSGTDSGYRRIYTYQSIDDATIDGHVHDEVFTYYWRDGAGGWNNASGQIALDPEHYDDGDGTLGNVGNSKYGVHWVYSDLEGDLSILYGRGSYSLAAAEDATTPATIPGILTNLGILVCRIIIEQGETTLDNAEFAVPWETKFTAGSVDQHNDLGGIQGGTAGEYYHLTATDDTNFNTLTDGSDAQALHIHDATYTASSQVNRNYIDNVSSNAKAAYDFSSNTALTKTGFATVSDGDTIAHGLPGLPTYANTSPSGFSVNFGTTCKVDTTNLTVYLTAAGSRDVFWTASL